MNPKYPIYIPTKGRWESRQTIRAFDKIKVPYSIVVEPQEYKKYAEFVDDKKIITLPWTKPNTNTELVKTRNWIKEHSISLGAKRHWQFDDNIVTFYRLNRNKRVRVTSGTIFRAAEDFVDRYTNVAISGFNYMGLARERNPKLPPFRLNTRIYSMSLVLNSIPHKWRGVYNDDTDICLRVLQDGWCTILFNAFLGDKTATMTVKGGNTSIYQKDGRLKMAKSLQEQHPHVTRVTRKWNRWQHHVNYKPYKHNKLIKRKNLIVPEGINEYGMILKKRKD
jgi:hypothetical protein